MGVRPLLGRFFTPEEDAVDGPRVVVLGEGLWRRRFGADPNVLGRELRLAGDTYDVIGVAPEAWNHSRLAWTEIWTTLRLNDARERTNIGRNSTMVARLKGGRSPAEATAEVATIMRQIAAAFPETHHPADSAVVLHARESVVGQSRATLWTLFGAVALVLLVSCANAANLLLSRASARQQEIAVRSALGASRRRLIGEWLIEGGLLAVGGALAGGGLAWAASRAVLVANPTALPRLDTVGIDAGTLLFAAGAAMVAGALVALPAALRSTRPDHAEYLRASARATTPSGTRRMHHALVVGEIGAALILVVGLALLGRSFARLLAVPVGFDGTSVLTMQITLPAAAYPTAPGRAGFFQNVLANVRTVPGVAAAGSARMVPLVPRSTSDSIIVEGRPIPTRGEQMVIVRENVVSPGYFGAIGIPLLQGRDFSEEEAWSRGGAIIVNRALAERLFPNEEAIGRRVSTGYEWRTDYSGESTIPWFTIVGVVENAVQRDLERAIAEEMFHPFINPYNELRDLSTTLTVRGQPGTLPSIRAAVARVDPAAAVSNIAGMDEIASRALAQRRLSLALFAAFAIASALMAAIGLYGSMAYAASQRVREIGVRLSMGARRGQIVTMFLREAATLTLMGVGIGTLAALILGGWMSSLLFDVSPRDPVGVLAGIVVVVVVALAASLIPSIRASRTDPAELFK